MRVPLLALLTTTLLLAGCFGGDEEPPATTSPTPTATATPTATPTNSTPTPTTPTNGGGNGGTPTTPTPTEACSVSGSYAHPPAPAGTPESETCTIPTGYTQVTMNVTWGGTPQVGNGIRVDLADAQGTVVLSCTFTQPTPGESAAPCAAGPAAITAPGDWVVHFPGNGSVTAAVSVTVS